jgi:hypothetical protein
VAEAKARLDKGAVVLSFNVGDGNSYELTHGNETLAGTYREASTGKVARVTFTRKWQAP